MDNRLLFVFFAECEEFFFRCCKFLVQYIQSAFQIYDLFGQVVDTVSHELVVLCELIDIDGHLRDSIIPYLQIFPKRIILLRVIHHSAVARRVGSNQLFVFFLKFF